MTHRGADAGSAGVSLGSAVGRILIVEDETRIASFVSRALRSKGAVVESIGSGLTAADLVVTGNYCLVLLDLILPGLDGESVLRRIMAAKPNQKVIILSALAAVDQKVRCLELGAVDYVCKPFSIEELLARIQAVLRERSPAQPDHFLRRGALTLDLARRKADFGHGEVHLTEREFVLLSHLMTGEGAVFSREELLSEVWGFSFDPGSNVVDVYIRRLRAKLGEDLIETVRNAGYSLKAS
jgi:DNA-binding response OmpR family regulator